MTFGDAKRLLQSIAITKVRHFAAQAGLWISRFQDINLPKRRTLLLFYCRAQVNTRDYLVDMFVYPQDSK